MSTRPAPVRLLRTPTTANRTVSTAGRDSSSARARRSCSRASWPRRRPASWTWAAALASMQQWLSVRGYDVHLLDIVPSHVQEAKRNGIRAAVGDARALPVVDGDYDAALLLGPLYHLLHGGRSAGGLARGAACGSAGRTRRRGLYLTRRRSAGRFRERVDRQTRRHPRCARPHARRTVDGARDGLRRHCLFPPAVGGPRRVDGGGSGRAGSVWVEGPGWVASNFEERWSQEDGRLRVLESARMCEEEPELLAMSPHLLAVCRRP